jgi:hypothetical protein
MFSLIFFIANLEKDKYLQQTGLLNMKKYFCEFSKIRLFSDYNIICADFRNMENL